MSGILGTHDLTGGVIQSIYQCDTDQFTTANISICNRHNVDVEVTLAMTDAENAFDDARYIEYATVLKPKGVLERSAVVVPTGKFLTVLSSHNAVSAVAWGIRAGDDISVSAITDNTDSVGPVWVTPASFNLDYNEVTEYQIEATDTSFVSYSLQSGTLPTGLGLSSSGLLTGITTEAGIYTPTFRATDESGNTTDLVTSIQVGIISTDRLTQYYDTTQAAYWTSGSDPLNIVSGADEITLTNVSNTYATRDGVTCLEFNDTGNLQMSQQFNLPRTYEIWVYHDQADPSSINWETYFDDNSTESILFGKQGSTNNVQVYTASHSGTVNVVPGQEWFHLAYTVNNTTSPYNGNIYKNGVAVASYSNLTRSLVSGNSTLYVGGDSGQGESMDGGVAIWRCYDRVLSADEIKQHFDLDKSKFGL